MKLSMRRSRAHQRGLSLVEVLVSLVIGLVVVGAVLLSYITSGQTNRLQAAYSQMNEEAQIGLGILSRDLLLAGYAQPLGFNSGTFKFDRTYSDHAVFGCDTGFLAADSAADVACDPAGTSPAIEVVYEADVTNTVPVGALPSDCLGNVLAAELPAGATTYYLAHNRYYVANSNLGRSELYCASWGNAGAPLVDNVEGMQILYGEANPIDPRQIVRYVSAANVKDLGIDFSFVVSVRVCLLMRSAEPVLTAEDPATYRDCDSVEQVSADRFARRAYFTTTALRNKMTF